MTGHRTSNALTQQEDWKGYYSSRRPEGLARLAGVPSIIDEYLEGKPGRIFELGCGGSPLLARSTRFDWEVGGIDFLPESIDILREYLSRERCRVRDLVCGDVLSYDFSSLAGQYDCLVSFGFVEHFTDPGSILNRWKGILRRDGLVITCIPNLFSMNALLLKWLDPDLWAQHVRYAPQDMDRFHAEAGLAPVRPARYLGRYDIHMLVPWDRIKQAVGRRWIFRMIKNLAYFGIGIPLSALPKSGLRLVNAVVMGVYANRSGPA